MKNSIIILVLIFTFQSVQSQVTDSLTAQSKQEMYDFYIAKNKKLKTTGWILLGTGVGACLAGASIAANNFTLSENETEEANKFVAGTGLFVVGAAATIASVPILIVSGSNKRKAKAILTTGNVGIGAIPFNDTRYASVGIKISF